MIAAQPWLFPLLAAFERLWTLPIQVALSVVVRQVLVRHNLARLWLAIGAHPLVDLVAVGLTQLAGASIATMLFSELIVAVWALPRQHLEQSKFTNH